MKQAYSFYYTAEEHRVSVKKEWLFDLPKFLFQFCFVVYNIIFVFFYALNYSFSDEQTFMIIFFAILLALIIITLIILSGCYSNTSPTRQFWNGKQECTLDGNKVTIHITMPNESKTDTFIIKKKVEKPEGTYLYKAFNYYVFLPSRVKPTIVND